MPKDDVAAFERFQLWLYTKGLLEDGESVDDISWDTLLDFYILGEVRGIPGLQNEIIDVSIDKSDHENEIPTTLLPRIYEETPQSCALRRLMVDWHAYSANLDDRNWFTKELENCSKEFFVDLVYTFHEIKMGTRPSEWDFQDLRSHYYVKDPVTSSDTSAVKEG